MLNCCRVRPAISQPTQRLFLLLTEDGKGLDTEAGVALTGED